MIELHPAQFILLDSFPMSVTDETGDTEFRSKELRVIVTDNRLYVLDDSPEGPVALVNAALQDFSGNFKDDFIAVTDEGTFRAHRETNCGCGSRIRGYHPFLGVPFQARYPAGGTTT